MVYNILLLSNNIVKGRGVASIGLSGLESPLCLPKVGSVGGPTVYGCTIAWPDKLKLLDKLYKIYN